MERLTQEDLDDAFNYADERAAEDDDLRIDPTAKRFEGPAPSSAVNKVPIVYLCGHTAEGVADYGKEGLPVIAKVACRDCRRAAKAGI